MKHLGRVAYSEYFCMRRRIATSCDAIYARSDNLIVLYNHGSEWTASIKNIVGSQIDSEVHKFLYQTVLHFYSVEKEFAIRTIISEAFTMLAMGKNS
jgi:hypothetical protein